MQGVQKYSTVSVLTTFLISFVLFGCLNRDNPWDPLNYHPDIDVPIDLTVQDSLRLLLIQKNFSNLFEPYFSITKKIKNTDSLKNSTEDKNLKQVMVNANINSGNLELTLTNDSLELSNQKVCETGLIQLKKPKDSLIPFLVLQKFVETDSELFISKGDTTALSGIRQSMDTLYQRDTLVTNQMRDSLIGVVSKTLDSATSLLKYIDSVSVWYENKNTTEIFPTDSLIAIHNKQYQKYNDSLVNLDNSICAVTINTALELQLKVPTLKPGDQVNLDSNTYSVVLTINQVATADSPIVFIGAPLGNTVLGGDKYIPLTLDGARNIHFKNIKFGNTDDLGIYLKNGSDSIFFENCEISSNRRGGIKSENSHFTLVNSTVHDNGGDGIDIRSDARNPSRIYLNNVLIYSHNGSGISAEYILGTLEHCTIGKLDGFGVAMQPPTSQVRFYRNIFYNNGAGSIRFAPELLDSTKLSLKENNFFPGDNPVYELHPNNGENYSADPFFSEDSNHNVDYRIGPQSELYLLNTPGNRLGYWPIF